MKHLCFLKKKHGSEVKSLRSLWHFTCSDRMVVWVPGELVLVNIGAMETSQ
jgi:hypothetical protein